MPWTEIIEPPAIKHMTTKEPRNTIQLAERLVMGEVNLAQLNERSLRLRKQTREGNDNEQQGAASKKRKLTNGTVSAYFLPSPNSGSEQAKHIRGCDGNDNSENIVPKTKQDCGSEDMSVQLKRISESNVTPFRKQTLSLLCQIPRGRYSTYQAMSDHISRVSHKTCARAVGNAMRNNPFAPEVPCHRVLAADGSIGGFKGHWGEEGKYASKKHEILHDEGVRFDSRGRAKGPPFMNFRSLSSDS